MKWVPPMNSVSVDESVRVWDVFSGRMVFEFITNHHSPLTSACIDHGGKRLLTGAHNGSLKIWNFIFKIFTESLS